MNNILNDENYNIYIKAVENNLKYLFDDTKYIDPDLFVSQEYKCPKNSKKTYILASDGICGIKYLRKYISDDNNIKDYYRTLRQLILVWPRHKESVNQRRWRKYRDRLDFTIYDIKQYYSDQKSYIVTESDKDYFNSFGGFNEFIECYGLDFLIKDNAVINLGNWNPSLNPVPSPIRSCEEYSYSKAENELYLDNLYGLLKNSTMSLSEMCQS